MGALKNNGRPGKLLLLLRFMTGGHSALLNPDWKAKVLRSLRTLVVGLFIIFALIILMQAVIAPWGRSLTGGPTLTGDWWGEIPLPSGQKTLAYFEVNGLIWGADECMRDCDINGEIHVCKGAGVLDKYTFDGDVSGRHAHTFNVDIRKKEDRSYGLMLSNLQGEWAGGDAVRLAGEWITDGPRAPVRIVTDSAGNTVMFPRPPPEIRTPVTFTLNRGKAADFQAACSRAGGSRSAGTR